MSIQDCSQTGSQPCPREAGNRLGLSNVLKENTYTQRQHDVL